MTLLEMLRHPELLIYFKHLALSFLWVCRKTKFILLFWVRPFSSLRLKHIYICVISCLPALFFKFQSDSEVEVKSISNPQISHPLKYKSLKSLNPLSSSHRNGSSTLKPCKLSYLRVKLITHNFMETKCGIIGESIQQFAKRALAEKRRCFSSFCFPWRLVREKEGREGRMFCLPSCGGSTLQDPLKVWKVPSCWSEVGI